MTSETFFARIEQQFDEEFPFVVYRKPNESIARAQFQKDAQLHTINDFSESGFIFAPFDSNHKAILIPSNVSERIETNISAIKDSKGPLIFKGEEQDKEQHVNLVQKGVDTIHSKELLKVVLSRCEPVSLFEANPIEIFKRLLKKYTSAFVYCWYHPKVGLWLGATPEALLQVEGNRFKTMALAGTQKYNGTLDVFWSEKEKEEQQIVTDSIYRNLKQKSDSITVSNAKTVRAGDLLHLQTKISGTILNKFEVINLKLLLGGLHPTPAVCGFPKEAAKQFILKNENYDREFYTGFLGELNIKETQTRNTNKRNVENNAYHTVKTVSNLFVNLRCMQLRNKVALIYVGGGVTKDSNADLEWTETVNKTQTIKAVLD